jgi:hypothetical protein
MTRQVNGKKRGFQIGDFRWQMGVRGAMGKAEIEKRESGKLKAGDGRWEIGDGSWQMGNLKS